MIKREQSKAILFADISGSSALYKKSGNQSAKDTVDLVLNAISQLVIEYKGVIVKSIGDEIMTSFNDCETCLNAAIAMQLRFTSLFQQPDLALSIGIGFGEIIDDNADIFGEAVNDAAYLTHVAKGGQILLSESVYQHLSLSTRSKVREFDKVVIKGANKESLIYRYFWQGEEASDSETRLMSMEVILNKLKPLLLELEYRGKRYQISSDNSPFTLGRDEFKCHLKVDADQVSREHCQIHFSRGKFVLVDHSTNGCYITTTDKGELYIRREEYPLITSASLSLGIRSEKASDDLITLHLLTDNKDFM